VTWSLKNAFPIKYDGGSLNASDGQVLVESVELAYESFTVTRG
jgi:phage tail-like protein